jgi:Rhodopirellula transposase DDE domain
LEQAQPDSVVSNSITLRDGHSRYQLGCRPVTPSILRRHRLFSFISQNWRAQPLVSYRVIVDLISATTTKTGLTVRCELDTGEYPSGIVVSDAEMATINIKRAQFHGEWNYTISPNADPPDCAFIS